LSVGRAGPARFYDETGGSNASEIRIGRDRSTAWLGAARRISRPASTSRSPGREYHRDIARITAIELSVSAWLISVHSRRYCSSRLRLGVFLGGQSERRQVVGRQIVGERKLRLSGFGLAHGSSSMTHASAGSTHGACAAQPPTAGNGTRPANCRYARLGVRPPFGREDGTERFARYRCGRKTRPLVSSPHSGAIGRKGCAPHRGIDRPNCQSPPPPLVGDAAMAPTMALPPSAT